MQLKDCPFCGLSPIAMAGYDRHPTTDNGCLLWGFTIRPQDRGWWNTRRASGTEAALREALRKIEARIYGSSHNMGSDIVTMCRAALSPHAKE